jgi:hypothetical protein
MCVDEGVHGWRLAVGGWRLAVGGWRLAVGGWRLAVGGWRLAVGGWLNAEPRQKSNTKLLTAYAFGLRYD